MKKKKSLLILLIVVLVLATMMSVFAACKPKPEPPEELTMEDAIGSICDSLRSTYLFEGVPFGWDAEMEVAGYAIKTQGRFDVADRNNTKMLFELSQGDKEIINLSADHTYLYATQNDWKRRFNDFQLQEMIENATFGSIQQSEEYMDLLQIGLTAIFSNETDTFSKTDVEGGSIYEITGNLGSAVGLLSDALKDADLGVIKDILPLLSEVDIVIKAKIGSDNKMHSFNIDLITPIKDINIGATKFELGKDSGKNIVLPEGRDNFITTNASNFTLQGDVTLKQRGNFDKIKDAYNMEYTIRVDYNIFKAMRESVKTVNGKMTLDPKGLFTDPSNKIYIDLNHKCGNDEVLCSFCSEYREGGSKGSFLTLAYAPEDFDNNNINVAVNVKQLLPKGLLSELVDLGGIDLIGMFDSNLYVGVGIDPLAFMINGDNYKEFQPKSVTTATSDKLVDQIAGIDFASMLNPNILGVLVDVFDFAKEIQFNETDGLNIGTKQLVNLLSYLDTDAFSISSIFSALFSESEQCEITVENAVYGDKTTSDLNLYEEYMIIDESLPQYKEFGFNNSKYSQVKSVDWQKDKAGNVVIKEKTIQNYDENGDALCISEQEARTLFTKGFAAYNFTTMNGETGTANVGLKNVYGLDYSKKGVEQTVTFVTYMTDNAALSGLLSLVGGFVKGLDLNFAGNYFTTKVIITDIEGEVKFEQGDDVTSKYNPETVYIRQNTKVNPYFTASVTYKGGSKKEVKVAPENLANFFGNYGTPDNAYVVAVNNFDAVYNVFGQVIKKPFKTEAHNSQTITVEQKVNTEYSVGTKFTAYKEGSASKVTVYSSKISAQMKATVTEGDADGITFTSNFTVNSLENGTFKFNKAGVYKVSLYVTGGLTQNYVFNITGGSQVGKIPGYSITSANYLANELTIDLARTNNIGEGMLVNFVFTSIIGGENVVLVNGTDYDLYEVVGNDRTKVAANAFLKKSYAAVGQKFVAVFKDAASLADTTKVSMYAVEYDNTMICEMNIVNAFKSYTFTADATAINAADEFGIKYTAVCPDDKAIDGLELAIELKVKVDGATDWTVLTAEDYYLATPQMWSTMVLGWVPNNDAFAFSNDGKKGGSDTYFVFKNITSDKIVYQINIYATNYNNTLVATATNAA